MVEIDMVSHTVLYYNTTIVNTKQACIVSFNLQGSTLKHKSKQYITYNFSSGSRIKVLSSVLESSHQALSIGGTLCQSTQLEPVVICQILEPAAANKSYAPLVVLRY